MTQENAGLLPISGNDALARRLRFGVFELDLDSGELRKAGTLVKLRQQPGKVLAFLAARPGHVVTRDELQSQVWGGDTFVDFDQGLNYCIKEIRAALSDSADTPLYVETLPRRGYRFIAPVGIVGDGSAQAQAAAHTLLSTAQSRRHPLGWLLWTAAAVTMIAVAAAAYLTSRSSPEPSDWQRVTYRRGWVSAARFAPGGEVVFSAAWDGGPAELYAAVPGAPDARALGVHGRLVNVSGRGEVAFLQALARPLPALARAPLAGGPPKLLLEDVVDADGTADGSAFAVAHVVAGQGTVIEYPIGQRLANVNGPSHLRLSPDASKLAFIEHPRTGDDRGYVIVLSATGRRLAQSGLFASAEGLAWSARGDEVWFSAARTGASLALRALDLRGRERTLLAASGRQVLADVSPTGRVLLDRVVPRGEIGFVGADGSVRELAWFDAPHAVSLSRDGRALLFSESGEAGGSDYSVYLRGTDGALPVRLGSGVPTSLSPDGHFALTIPLHDPDRIDFLPTGPGETRSLRYAGIVQYEWAALTPDGARVVFVGGEKNRNMRVWVGALDGGRPRPITPEGLIVARDTISPDGRQLVAPCPPLTFCLYPLEGGEARVIPGRDGMLPTGWDASGRYLYLRAPSGPARLALEKLDIETGTRTRFREIGPRDPVGVSGISNVVLSRDGASLAFTYYRRLSELYLVPRLVD